MSTANKSRIKLVLKLAFVAGLLYLLSRKGFLSLKDTHRAITDWDNSLPAFATLVFTALLGVIRWQLLLKAQGIVLPLSRTFQLTLIGNFFNIALPGAVSGDFVKAFYIGKELHGQRARAFGSILFDRVAGLSALVCVAAGAMVFGLQKFEHTALLAGTRVFLIVAAVCVIIFYCYLFLVRAHHDPVLKMLKALESRFVAMSSLTRIYESLRHYHSHRATVLYVLAISIVVHVLVAWACYRFASALGETNLQLLALCVIVPMGLLVTAVPVAPAGVGTGHAAFLFLFGLLGSQRGADVFTLYAMSNILIGAFGGLVYLRFRTQEPMSEPEFDAKVTYSQ